MFCRSLVLAGLTLLASMPRQASAQISISMDTRSTQIGGPGSPIQLDAPNAVPMPAGSGTVLGRAVEFGTTRPIPGALVVMTLPGSAALRVLADQQGQFAFRDLPPGRFNITASRPGYVDGAYGRLRPGGPTLPLEMTADQHATEVAIPLWKYGVITGRVTDERGEPIVGTSVRVLKRTVVAGRRQFAMGATTQTDDRGIYRLSSLEPAEYLVVVPMTQPTSIDSLMQSLGMQVPSPLPAGGGGGGGGTVMFAAARVMMNGNDVSVTSSDSGVPPAGANGLTYSMEFYPGASAASRATTVAVASGEERGGIDFQVKPVRAVNVSGRVIPPGGQAPAGMQVTIVPADADDLLTPIEIASAPVNGNGEFKFSNVPTGQYVLHVLRSPRMGPANGDTVVVSNGGSMVTRTVTRNVLGSGFPAPPLPTEPTLWADVPLNVATTDVADVAIPLKTGLKVSGRVQFNGAATQPTADQMSSIGITLEPADGRTTTLGSTGRGRVETDGTFSTVGVPAGKYLMRVTGPGPWTLGAATVNGMDISDRPIELEQGDTTGVVISFTDRVADVRGTVTSSNGQPDSGAAVMLFPSDRGGWLANGANPRRQRNVRTGSNGSFTIGNVPPGDYFLVAVSDAAAADWPGADFLSTLSRTATRISVGEGEKKQQTLTTQVVR